MNERNISSESEWFRFDHVFCNQLMTSFLIDLAPLDRL